MQSTMEVTMGRTRYTDEQKAEALALFAEAGAAEAARQTGIPDGTIKSWASRAGVATDAAANIRAATEVAAARRTFVAEEFRARMVQRLAAIAEAAAERELVLHDEADLRAVVGSRTRAIHDLQLLTGAATGRTETVERTPEVDAELARVIKLRRSA